PEGVEGEIELEIPPLDQPVDASIEAADTDALIGPESSVLPDEAKAEVEQRNDIETILQIEIPDLDTGEGGVFADNPLVLRLPFDARKKEPVDAVALASPGKEGKEGKVEMLKTVLVDGGLQVEIRHLSYLFTLRNRVPEIRPQEDRGVDEPFVLQSSESVQNLTTYNATVAAASPALKIDLSQIFTDQDLPLGDKLSYSREVEILEIMPPGAVSDLVTAEITAAEDQQSTQLQLQVTADKWREGHATITVRATDTNGQISDPVSFVIQVTSIMPIAWQTEIALLEGLNLVSLPLQSTDAKGQPVQWTASDVADKTGATVLVAYDPNQGDSGEFIPFIPQVMKDEAGNYVDHGFAIQAGQGYIINVLETSSLLFQGQPWGQLVRTEEGQQSVDSGTELAVPSNVNNGLTKAPPAAASDPWTFVISGDLVLDPALSSGFDQATVSQIVAVNHQTGKQLSGRIQGSRFHFVLADLSMRPVVAEGQAFEIRAEDKDENLIAGPVTWQLNASHLRQAYLHQQLTIGDVIPNQTRLLPNYPNPFNPETWIPFELEQGASVSMTIFGSRGNTVRQLNLGYKGAGRYLSQHRAAYWNGRNALGEPVGSGIYFYTFIADGTEPLIQTRKMVILK
ncbi:MAG: hypothetical protein QGH37_08340, partial [Candidatus Poribacteria bacterium]|nr:hypothetical protein [Candidatus Poribacteria bacterium]